MHVPPPLPADKGPAFGGSRAYGGASAAAKKPADEGPGLAQQRFGNAKSISSSAFHGEGGSGGGCVSCWVLADGMRVLLVGPAWSRGFAGAALVACMLACHLPAMHAAPCPQVGTARRATTRSSRSWRSSRWAGAGPGGMRILVCGSGSICWRGCACGGPPTCEALCRHAAAISTLRPQRLVPPGLKPSFCTLVPPAARRAPPPSPRTPTLGGSSAAAPAAAAAATWT